MDLITDQVNIHEAKTQFSRLVERAESGEEIVVARHGRPVAKLVPLEPAGTPRPRRAPGRFAGEIEIGSDFEDPLPPDIAAGFGLGS